MRQIDMQAKMAGAFYLIYITLLISATTLRSQMVVEGDAAETAKNIMANETLFRTSFMMELVAALFFALAAWGLYRLLKNVNKDIALLFLILNLCGVAVQCMSIASLVEAHSLLSGADYLASFSVDQLQAHALLDLGTYHDGFVTANLFFGAWLLPLGYLVYRSGFLPRWLGVLLMADFVGVTSWVLQYFLLPDYGMISTPGFVVGFVAEVSLALWLLFRGVKENEPSPTEEG